LGVQGEVIVPMVDGRAQRVNDLPEPGGREQPLLPCP
jgi:hypothetical protein